MIFFFFFKTWPGVTSTPPTPTPGVIFTSFSYCVTLFPAIDFAPPILIRSGSCKVYGREKGYAVWKWGKNNTRCGGGWGGGDSWPGLVIQSQHLKKKKKVSPRAGIGKLTKLTHGRWEGTIALPPPAGCGRRWVGGCGGGGGGGALKLHNTRLCH